MYRVFILLSLAIGLTAFAVDSSGGVLQAKKISDSRIILTWQPISGATKYRALYDESTLLDSQNPQPLLDTDFFVTNEGEITGMTPATEYTFVVQGYTSEGKEVGKTLPLHAKTYSAVSQMNIVGNPFAIDDVTLEMSFSRPINIAEFQIVLKDLKTKKDLAISGVKSSPEDMRTVLATLKNKLEISNIYELSFKKVVALDGAELSSENRLPLKIVYAGSLPPLTGTITDTSLPVPPQPQSPLLPAAIINPEPVSQPFQEPVLIDKLPQTGPENFLVLILLSLGIVFLVRKKLVSK